MKKINFKIKWHLLIFPFFALIFVAWFGKKYYDEKGKEITVSFVDAKSIQPEKTKVFYRGVPIGVVNKVTISKDSTKAICHIALQREAEQFAVSGTRFYLVSPKVSFEGISGLETLISGSYIALEPSKKKGKPEKDFKGEQSKEDLPEDNTSTFLMQTDHAESVSTGDSVFYRGIVIGNIGNIRLNKTAQKVLINLNIQNRHLKLMRTNTAIWKKQGVKADLGLFNSKIKINSLDTILKGGVEIGVPNNNAPLATRGFVYNLLDDEPKDREDKKWNPALSYPKSKKK